MIAYGHRLDGSTAANLTIIGTSASISSHLSHGTPSSEYTYLPRVRWGLALP